MMAERSVLDLFSGIGGFSLGLHWAGYHTVGFCEADPFCQRVLARHWPGVPIYPDIRTLDGDRLRQDGIAPFLICGGFPCQDVSAAGSGAGLDGARSGLWHEMARLVGICRPRWVIVENVPALRTRGADRVVGDLAALDYAPWTFVVGAAHAGAPHRRQRLFLLARDLSAHAPGARLALRQRDATREPTVLPVERLGGWLAEPPLRRVEHGFPGRVDRVRSLGNAVVPALAAALGRSIAIVDGRAMIRRVLIVEDEALVALTLEDVLTEAGYLVCGVADRPEQAFEIARLLEPDIAVVDVRLADGGDGIALAGKLAELRPLLILFATGNPAEVRARARAGHGCLSKPFQAECLLDALAVIEARQAGGKGAGHDILNYFPLAFP